MNLTLISLPKILTNTTLALWVTGPRDKLFYFFKASIKRQAYELGISCVFGLGFGLGSKQVNCSLRKKNLKIKKEIRNQIKKENFFNPNPNTQKIKNTNPRFG